MEQEKGKTSPILILLIGVIIGLLASGAFLLLKGYFAKRGTSPPTTETRGIVLSLTKPVDGAVVDGESLTIEGTSGKEAVIAVVGGSEDVITETSNGNFSVSLKLTEGENELGIYAFDITSGESTQTTLGVLYLKEDSAALNVLVAAAETDTLDKNKERIESIKQKLATDSADLRKAASATNKSHVFGTIAALGSNNFTLELRRGGSATIFTDDLTKFFSIGEGGKAAIAFSDLKIGDKVAVVGVGKDTTTGAAEKVIKLGKQTAKRLAVAGKVKSIEGNILTLSHIVHSDRTFTVNVGSDTKIKIKGKEAATLADAKVDDVVVAAGSVDEKGVIAAKRVFVIPGKFEGVKPKESTQSATPSSTQ